MNLVQLNTKTMSSRENGLISNEEFTRLSKIVMSDEYSLEDRNTNKHDFDYLIGLGMAMHTLLNSFRFSEIGSRESNEDMCKASWSVAENSAMMIRAMGIDTNQFSCAITSYMASIYSQAVKSNKNEEKISESEYRDELINNFDSYFSEYIYVNHEVKVSVDDADRIDILAKTEYDQPVIMELKLGCKSAHKQLRSYAVGFENPLLINISEDEPKNKRSDIKYMTFKELGVFHDL